MWKIYSCAFNDPHTMPKSKPSNSCHLRETVWIQRTYFPTDDAMAYSKITCRGKYSDIYKNVKMYSNNENAYYYDE
jgi:hypothetical protein